MPYCPYFTSAVREIVVPGLLYPMRVRVCRCALTEEAVSRLLTHPEGIELAHALSSVTHEGNLWPLIGPDMEGIAATACTATRQEEICSPAFVELLLPFQLASDLLPEAPADPSEQTV